MQSLDAANSTAPLAVVARMAGDRSNSSYLQLTPAGAPVWVEDASAATAFASMREATRMAMRLPATLRAFGLLRAPELAH
jgi:hypothetical protein